MLGLEFDVLDELVLLPLRGDGQGQHQLTVGGLNAIALLPRPLTELDAVEEDEDVRSFDHAEVAHPRKKGRLHDRGDQWPSFVASRMPPWP